MSTDELVVSRQDEPRTGGATADEARTGAVRVRSGGVWPMVRPLLLRLHFYAGILAGPLLLIAAFTGLLYTVTPQLEQAVYDHELHVPASPGSRPLDAQLDAARAANPGATIKAVRPSPTPVDTTQVIFNAPELPESHYRTVFVNPHTAEVRGTLETYGSSQSLPVRTWIAQLHRNLHLGDAGRIYSELAASWLWLVVGGGLALWWQRRRRARRMFLPDRRGRGRRRVLSWHASAGTWLAIVLLFLSATGLTWSLFAGENVTAMREAFGWQTPSVSGGSGEHAGHGGASAGQPADAPAVPPAVALDTARAYGVSGQVELSMPEQAGDPYVVQQTSRQWPVQEDSIAVDTSSGAVLDMLRFEDYPLIAKLARWGIAAHMGVLFGIVNQIVLAVVALGLLTMIVLAYRMWWLRRPTRGGFGRPFPRGAWRALPRWSLVPLVLAAVAVGWFLPLFGASLVVFLAIDVLLGRRSRARAAG